MNIGYASKGIDFFEHFFVHLWGLENPLFLQITSWTILQSHLQQAQTDLHGLVVLFSHYLKHHGKSRSPVKKCWDQFSLEVGVK